MDWAHRCKACKTAEDVHTARHREIATLVNKLHKMLEMHETPYDDLPPAPLSQVTGHGRTTDESIPTTPTRKERKAAKKATKALNPVRDKVPTNKDVEIIASILHPQNSTLSDTSPTGLDVTPAHATTPIFNALPFQVLFTTIDPGITTILHGLHPAMPTLSSSDLQRADVQNLLHQLSEAIETDLLQHAQATARQARRAEAFWRWAHKSAAKDLRHNGGAWEEWRAGRVRYSVSDTPEEGVDGNDLDEVQDDGSNRALELSQRENDVASEDDGGCGIGEVGGVQLKREEEEKIRRCLLSANGGLYHVKARSEWVDAVRKENVWFSGNDIK